MKESALTPEWADALDRDGYVVVEGAIDAHSIERLRLAFDDAPAREGGTLHVELTPETPEFVAWEGLKLHRVVLAAARHVLGRPFEVTELHGRSPLPGYGDQGLHADDAPRESVEPYFVLTAIWMIDDFTVENGATRVVPGSHRLVRPIAKSLAQPGSKHPAEVIAVGTAGSVLIFNGHTWHSGRRNASDAPRRAAQMVIRALA